MFVCVNYGLMLHNVQTRQISVYGFSMENKQSYLRGRAVFTHLEICINRHETLLFCVSGMKNAYSIT